MKWFVSYPESGRSVAFYRQWLKGAGIDCVLAACDFSLPKTIAAFDALLLAGGGDVAPARYGEPLVHPETYDISEARDEAELRLIDEVLGAGKPVFGICRGIQILCVAKKGRLIQHVPDYLDGKAVETHALSGRYGARHPVAVAPGGVLAEALAGVTEVNSFHHQAVDPTAIGTGLRVAARSGGGIIEAVESASRGERVVAVQWHPERLESGHPASSALIGFMKDLV